MKHYILLFLAWLFVNSSLAQNTITATVKDSETSRLLAGVDVKLLPGLITSITDASGQVVFTDVPTGKYIVRLTRDGYAVLQDSIMVPILSNQPLLFFMKRNESEELDEVIITSTRSSRTIANLPTRIELIAGEELDEKANMKPGDIRMVLNESTGIQTQQTSAISGNASIRIQGLDGRYTQILKDGFPLYSGAASGLGLLQIPPLDLKQVEVIKGSASTLYGGGAIAGLVNLVSKTPTDERELNFHLNGTSAGGLDLNGFYSERFNKLGVTLFASRNSNQAYDPSSTGLTAIPKFERYVFNPKLFVDFNENTSLVFGLNSAFEDRIGGDLNYINSDKSDRSGYFERNNTNRLASQLAFTRIIDEKSKINLRNSLSYFKREIAIPDYIFNGTQYGTFSELNYMRKSGQSEWVAGLNLWTDHFQENSANLINERDYQQNTFGAFVQSNLHLAQWLELEAGLRGDYVSDYGLVVLPRLSALFKVSEGINSRFGGGLGYKAPTVFTEESERIQYQNVLPITAENKLERSYGLNWDVNYFTSFLDGTISLSINNMLYYTFLNNPLTMKASGSNYKFENLAGHIDTKGIETNVKLGYDDFKLFVGYTLTDTKIHSGGNLSRNPLTAKHRLNNVLMYEVEDKWKLGAEAYYYDKQILTDNTTGKPYWIFGFMAEKLWERFSLYINFENFTDTRQTRFNTIYTGSIANPVFRDIYAPLDGFVVNGGLKLRL